MVGEPGGDGTQPAAMLGDGEERRVASWQEYVVLSEGKSLTQGGREGSPVDTWVRCRDLLPTGP